MSSSKAEFVAANTGDGVANTDALLFTSTSSSLSHAVPTSWHGQFLRVLPETENVWYLFSTNSAAVVDRTLAAAADGGGNVARGEKLLKDQYHHVRIPQPATPGGSVYFVRQAAATGTVQITRASR